MYGPNDAEVDAGREAYEDLNGPDAIPNFEALDGPADWGADDE